MPRTKKKKGKKPTPSRKPLSQKGKAKVGNKGKKKPRWTPLELGILVHFYPVVENERISEYLKKSASSILSQANKLGLKKSQEFLTFMGRKNVSPRYEGRRRAS